MTPTRPVSALLIDLDGVIRHWPESDAAIEAAHGLPAGALRKTAFRSDLLHTAITGAITDAAWRSRVAEQLSKAFGTLTAVEAVSQWTAQTGRVDTEVLGLLTRCVAQLRIVLVSNATSRLHGDLQALGMADHFHAIVNSSEEGVAKPDPALFRIALDRAGCPADAALFVDDTAANVAAATALGLQGHHYTTPARLSAFLQEAGVFVTDPLPLRTPRTTLRRLSADDLEPFHAYRSDAEVGRYQGWTPMTREQVQAFLAEMSNAPFCPDEVWFQLAIAEGASGLLIGDIGICVHTGDDAHAEIGFTLAPQAQHQGLGTEAVRAAVEMLFEHTAIKRVIGITDARNIASLRLLERIGMNHTQTLSTLFRGEPCTELLCELRRPAAATTSILN